MADIKWSAFPSAVSPGAGDTLVGLHSGANTKFTGLTIPFSPTIGGTGVANLSGSTITLGGAFAMSGAFGFTGTLTGTTAVTFPTSGTLATSSQIPSLPLSLANGGTGQNLTAVNSAVFSTTSGGVTQLSTTLPSGLSATSMNLTTPSIGAATGISLVTTSFIQSTLSGLRSGSSAGGFGGELDLFSVTANKGFLSLKSIDNVGNFTVQITNASFGQSTVLTLPDPGASTATFAYTNAGTQNQLAWFAANGSTLSGLPTANLGVLVTSSGGVPSISNIVPGSLTIHGVYVGNADGASSVYIGSNPASLGSGSSNTTNGANALVSITNGSNNTAMGASAGTNITTGGSNTSIGQAALQALVGNSFCTAIGAGALFSGTGSNNTAIGYLSGYSAASGAVATTSGSSNTYLGYEASGNSATIVGSIAIGAAAVALIATGATSSDNGPGISVGSAAFPVGFRGDATVYPTAGVGLGTLPLTFTGYWRVVINGTAYKIPLYPDA